MAAPSASGTRGVPPFDPASTVGPDPVLLRYVVVVSIFAGPFFPIAFLAGYCRYVSLRYRFDEEGVRMSWGVLFKREVNLAYRRIQDIHVHRNVVQRWLGLASVAVQTASAGMGPEMKIDGVLDADGLRDFLYSRMRGAKGHAEARPDPGDPSGGAGGGDEVLSLLTDIRDGVTALRARVDALEAGATDGGDAS